MVKKKSKYQSLIINKKRYYFYKLVWEDIVGDSGHATMDEFKQMKTAEMVTYGYVFEKTKEYIKTFASYDSKEESFSDRNIIPTGCIKSVQKINI